MPPRCSLRCFANYQPSLVHGYSPTAESAGDELQRRPDPVVITSWPGVKSSEAARVSSSLSTDSERQAIVEGHPQAEVRSDAGLRDLGIGKYAHFRGERVRRAFRVGDESQGAQRVVALSACRDGREVRGMPHRYAQVARRSAVRARQAA
jgi:hypothetical protein